MSYPGQNSGYPPYQQAPGYPPANQQPIGFTQYPLNQYHQQDIPPYPLNPTIPPLPTQHSAYPPYPPNNQPFAQNTTIPPLPSQSSYPPMNQPFAQNTTIPPLPSQQSSYPPYPPMNPPLAQNQSSAPYPTPMNPPLSQAYPTPAYQTQAYPTQAYPTQAYSNPQQLPHQAMHNFSAPAITQTPTVRPVQPFNPRQDAEVLRKAMKGFGTDEKTIIYVLANRSNQQRMEIRSQFKVLFGKDLIKELKSELSGTFEILVQATMMPVLEFLCQELRRAICGTGTDEWVLIEILCSTIDNSTIRSITAHYQHLFRKSLESDIKGDTSGHFQRLLVSLCQGNRDQNPTVNMQGAVTDAQALYQAGAKRFGTDESTFNMIMASRSFPQLRQIFAEYHKISSGRTMEQAIRSEFSGDIMNAHLAIVKCVQSTPEFFAERLYHSLQGLGTKDRALVRLVTWRSEIDMGDIKSVFQRKYHKSLESFIQGDTSGDYKNMLISMIN